MHWLNWLIVIGWLSFVVIDGIRRSRGTTSVEGYFLANRSIPWWAVGLSVMATQLSAVTMIGTTGQGAVDGMRFIQFYFGLPVAMVILGVTLVPFLHGARVYTAYEYLENRFDAKTRSFTSLLFLLSRGLSVGAVVSAPAVVLSLVLGWNLTATSLAITMPAVVYTMFGGVQAVTWTDIKTMSLIVGGLLVIIATAILDRLLHHSTTLNIRGESYRLKDRRRAGLLPGREQEEAQPGTPAGVPLLAAKGTAGKRKGA